MIELGIACSSLYEKYRELDEDYIIPFVIGSLKKSQALAGTPLLNLQIGSLYDKDDVHSFLEYLSTEKNNAIAIPLKKMQSEALQFISEICFVIHPNDVSEKEGMFKLSNIKIDQIC